MKILAVDSSSEVCSVAILEDDVLIDEINLDNGRTHSENLMPIIKEIVDRNNIALSDLGMIACCVGPGSFTGIRIGVATIKPIAEVLNIKIASVTSLETLSKNVQNENIRVSMIDARNNQVYAGIFDSDSNLMEDYLADDINEVINHIKNYSNVTLIGNGAILHKDLILASIPNASFIDDNKQSAKNVGLIGLKKFKENDLKDADTIIPIYLRKSQAERLKK